MKLARFSAAVTPSRYKSWTGHAIVRVRDQLVLIE